MTTRLSLVCHAPSSANRGFSFPADEAVDEGGQRKLAEVTERFDGVDRACCSPALRARQTATALGLTEADPEPALRDWDYGAWTGRALAEVEAEDPDAVRAWLSDPGASVHGGETLLDVIDRSAHWLDRQSLTSGSVVAVTHAAVVRAAVVTAIKAPPASFWRIDIAPLWLVKLCFNQNRWTIGAIRPLFTRQRADRDDAKIQSMES